jgi:hypothetical protein
MKNLTEPARITWALLGRATLLAPALAIVSVVYIGSAIGRFVLPVLIVLSMWAHDWPIAALYGVAWILCLALWQWRRFRNLWEDPPSLL